jgi:Cys-tRNA synthase (O-phospho-L-seryl-tRNA:Cys-tRNA synthase)
MGLRPVLRASFAVDAARQAASSAAARSAAVSAGRQDSRVQALLARHDELLAAHRAGVSRVLIPEENRPDLDELPQWLKETLEILPVSHMDQVLLHALVEASEKKIGFPPSAAP